MRSPLYLWVVMLAVLMATPVLGTNLLENSSFEVGFGHGWARHAWYPSESSRPLLETNDWATVAYDGERSLRLPNAWVASNGISQKVMSKAYRMESNTKYLFSAWAKSTRTGDSVRLGIVNTFLAPGTPADSYEGTFGLSGTNWTRVSFEYTTTSVATNCTYHVYIRPHTIADAGCIYFDALQLEIGSNSYAPVQPIELGLSCSNVPGNVFLDEAPRVTARIYNTGAATNLTLYLRVWDYWNSLALSNSITLSVGTGLTSTNLSLGSLTNWNSYRLQAWLDAVPVSMDELNVSVLPTPHTMGVDPNGNFGSHIRCHDHWLDLLRKCGLKWNRDLSTENRFRWSLVEPTEGNVIFYDAEIALSASYGFCYLASVGQGIYQVPMWAQWYDTNNTVTLSFNENDTDPDTISKPGGEAFTEKLRAEDIIMVVRDNGWSFTNNGVYHITAVTSNTITLASTNDVADSNDVCTNCHLVVLDSASGTNRGWTGFVQALADHYGQPGQTNSVSYWEICNEPDDSNSGGLGQCAVGYGYMLKSAYDRFKAANSNCVVVGMAAWNYSFIQRVVDAVGSNCFDVISSHIYPNGESGGGSSGYGAQRLIQECLIPYGKQGWNTESGLRERSIYQTLLWEDEWTYSAAYRPEIGADHKVKTDRIMWNLFLSMGNAIGGYSYQKYISYDARNTTSPDWKVTYSIFEWDGTLRPRAVTLAIAAHFLDYYTGQGQWWPSGNSNVNAYAFTSVSNPAPYVVMHSITNHGVYKVETTLDSTNIVAYDLMGQPLDISTGIVFTCTPIYIKGIGVSSDTLSNSLTVVAATDTAPPRLSLVTWPIGPQSGSSVLLRWFALDDLTYDGYGTLEYSYRLTGVQEAWSDWVTGTNAVGVTFRNVPSGSHTFYVRCKDLSGNTATNTLLLLSQAPAIRSFPFRVTRNNQ